MLMRNFYSSTLRDQNNFLHEVNSSLTKITLIYENAEGFSKEHVFTASLRMLQKLIK